MGLPEGPKSFRIGLVVLIQYRLWQTPSQPATQPASHVAVAITLNAKASSLKMFKNAQNSSQVEKKKIKTVLDSYLMPNQES